jgi:hypothetical protein
VLLLDPVKPRETEEPTTHPNCAKTRLPDFCWAEAAVDTALRPGNAWTTSTLSLGARAAVTAGPSREQEAASGHRPQQGAGFADSSQWSFSVEAGAAGSGALQGISHWLMLRLATEPVGAGAPRCHY